MPGQESAGEREQVSAAVALPSVGLFITSTLHALPLAWAAVALPISEASWFTFVVGTLALLHAAVAVLALLRRERALTLAWRVLALYSLALLLGMSVVVASSALYLSELYRGVGPAVSAALFGIWGLFVLLTVPVSAWGLAYTVPRRSRPRLAIALAGAALLTLLLALGASRFARATPIEGADAAALAAGAAELVAQRARSASDGERTLLHEQPAPCREPVAPGRLTLLASALDREGRPVTACLQASDQASLLGELARWLAAHGGFDARLKLDLVRGVQRIPRVHPLFAALSLRPGLDGVCGARGCLAPWQLVSRDAFTRYHPLEAVRDASFGVALDELAQSVGNGPHDSAPLLRIEAASYLIEGARVVPLVRLRPARVALDRTTLERAIALAGRHLVAAQRDDGSFRYLLDPFSGRADTSEVNLPRQAGTTLALCEIVADAQADVAIRRALAQLRAFERQAGELSAISEEVERAPLGQSALPLAAFATCRARVGPQYDELIARVARLLLALQRPNGSFAAEYDLIRGAPQGAHQGLYAAGQAVLALVLVEQLSRAHVSAALPAASVLHDAVERAMAYYGQSYWPRPLRSLFYLEENWHCLAARAALLSHRHDAYERFCLDYVEFKSRLILSERDEVDPEHVGGYSLSNMFPPHSTTTAGYAEALAGAMAVAHARGLSLDVHRERIERALSFLVRQQWTAESCFACAAGGEAIGAFSESAASPAIRIDYVQHALAALAHGQSALALASAE